MGANRISCLSQKYIVTVYNTLLHRIAEETYRRHEGERTRVISEALKMGEGCFSTIDDSRGGDQAICQIGSVHMPHHLRAPLSWGGQVRKSRQGKADKKSRQGKVDKEN